MLSLKNNHVFFFVLLFPIFLLISWFSDGMIKGAAESGLPFYNIAKEYRITSYAWIPDGLGNSSFTTVAGNFFYGFFYLLDFLGLPKFLQQGVFFYLSFFLSGLGMIYLCKFFIPNIRSIYILFAILFYWFNPISAFNVWNRFLNNFIFFWAVLPLIYYFYLNCLIKKKYLDLLPLVFLIFMSSYTFSSISLLLLLFILFSLTIIFLVLIRKEFSYFSFGLKHLFVFFILFILSNFWWIIQLFSFRKSSNYDSVVSSFFGSEGNVSTLVSLSQRMANLGSIFRMTNEEAINSLAWAGMYNIPPIKLLMFLPVLLILILIFKKKIQLLTKVLILLFIAFVFLAKGSNPPFAELFLIPFERLIFLQSFRNSFEKFSLVLILIVSISTVVAIDTIKNSKLKKLTEFLFVFLLIVYMYPFFTGKVLSSNTGFNNNAYDNYSVKVPKYYSDVNNFLSDSTSYERTLVLPIGGEGMTYTWDYPYSGVELSNAIFNTPVISFNTTIPYYYEIVKSIEENQLRESFFDVLRYLNVRYVILRNDVDYEIRSVPDPQNVQEVIEKLSDQGRLSLVFDKERLKVYEINEIYRLPKFYISQINVASNSDDLVLMVNALGEDLLKKSFFTNSNNHSIDLDCELILPRQSFLYLDRKKYKNFGSFTDEDITSRLFHAKHLPGSKIYPLIRIKENIELSLQKDIEARFIFRIGLLGKRAVEIYKLHKAVANTDLIQGFQREYEFLLMPLLSDIRGYYYGSRVLPDWVREFFYLQLELLSRVDTEFAEKIRLHIDSLTEQPRYLLSKDNFYVYVFKIENPNEYKILNLRDGDEVYFEGQTVDIRKSLFLDKGDYEISVFSDEERKIALLQEKNYPTKTSTVVKGYERVNPTEYNVKISKADNKEEILVFSELFDSNWEAYYDSGELIDAGKHLKVNVYANAWVIDRAGDYQLKIIYTPQKSLEIGKKVSLITVTILLTVYILLVLKHKKYHVN